ncbi:MAG: hypothetical protein ACR2F1_00965 [Nitrososphaeraceae archaeon]
MSKPKLTDKQMEVLNYIIKNPNQTENKIVMAFKGTYARLSVLKTIHYLAENGIINIKKINSNQHEIIPNTKNLLTNLIQDLSNFEYRTFILTNQLQKIIKQRKIELDHETIQILYFIYQHQILMYLLHSLFVWPSTIKDDEILSTMYLTLFPKLRKILTRLEMKISQDSKIVMRLSLVDNFFNLTPDVLNKILETSKKYDIKPEIEKLLDTIWKNSKIFYPDIKNKLEKNDSKHHNNNQLIPETWQDVLNNWNNKNNI